MKKDKLTKLLLAGIPLLLLIVVLIYYAGRIAGELMYNLTNQ